MVLVAALALAAPATGAAQGILSANPRPREVAPIETDLPPIVVDFRDVAAEAGLGAVNVSGGREEKDYILETTGNGVAVLDYDGDGRMDVFLPNGSTLDGDGGPARNHLYRNLGGLRFEDVTAEAGLAGDGWAQGACVGDYDGDGDPDLYVTHYGRSVLYRNDGGAFHDVTDAAGVAAGAVRWDTGCTFVDFDLDGRLDLAVTAYLEFDRSKIPAPGSTSYCVWKGLPVMCGPRGLPFAHNRLLRNEGEGRFRDVSRASGFGATAGCYAFTVVASDLDNDGWPDLYVACDSTPSLLFHNQRDGTFEEVGLLAGAALNENGQEQGGMGVTIGDYDDDGWFDIVKTNFSDDVPNVYRNAGDLSFEDRVFEAGVGGYMEHVGWGVHLMDADNDGHRELLIVNGHVYPEVERSPEIRYRQPRLLYWNVGGGRFIDVSRRAGQAFETAWCGRGSAVADLDDDGSLEVVINNMGERPSLLRNFAATRNWLLVRCRGSRGNRDGLGARVFVHVEGRRLSAEVQGGSGYLSQNDPRLHFGLGGAERYERIEVLWPGGRREVHPGGAANRVVEVREGEGTSGGGLQAGADEDRGEPGNE